jgi:hypothetical protein
VCFEKRLPWLNASRLQRELPGGDMEGQSEELGHELYELDIQNKWHSVYKKLQQSLIEEY